MDFEIRLMSERHQRDKSHDENEEDRARQEGGKIDGEQNLGPNARSCVVVLGHVKRLAATLRVCNVPLVHDRYQADDSEGRMAGMSSGAATRCFAPQVEVKHSQ